MLSIILLSVKINLAKLFLPFFCISGMLFLSQGLVINPPVLAGGDAAGYAMVKSQFETTDEFMSRTNQVLRAVFENQQGDEARVDEVLSALGSLAKSNVPTQSIARLIVELRTSNLWSSANISRVPSN
jgi:hypothetical protein